MTHFWSAFEKRSGMANLVGNAAAKAEHVLDYSKFNRAASALSTAAKAAPAELNYQKMKPPAATMPRWKARMSEQAPKMQVPGRQGWSPEMKDKILSGATAGAKPRAQLPPPPMQRAG